MDNLHELNALGLNKLSEKWVNCKLPGAGMGRNAKVAEKCCGGSKERPVLIIIILHTVASINKVT